MVSTSSRRITRLTWLMLCLPGSVHGAETRELLTGLRDPVAIATSPAAAGGVLIVERGARAVTLWDAKNGESELISEPPEKLADKALSPTAVSYLSDQAFVVAWGGGESNTAAIALYTLGADDQKPSAVVGSVRRLGEDELPRDQGTVRTLARGERFLYATAGASPSTVLRARHNSGLLSKFRPITEVPGTVASIAESPRGYLTAVVDGGIEFFEASAASGGTLARYQTGLADVTAVAYGTVPRPIDRLLYVLGSGKPTPQSQGVCRIDAAVDDSGHPAAAATPIVEGNNLRSMAFTADGRLLLLQAGPSTTGGRLLEVDQPL